MKKVHRFCINTWDCDETGLVVTDPVLLSHVSKVLRLNVGEKIECFDGTGRVAEGTIAELNRNFLRLSPVVYTNYPKPAKQVTIYASILKRENFEWIAEKAGELGIHEIIPIITDRTVKLGLQKERLQKIATEASELSGHAFVPVIGGTITYDKALGRAREHNSTIIFDFDAPRYEPKETSGSVGIFIGPEGGWSEREIILARESGYSIVSLGKMMLRAETAATIAMYVSLL
jgi:16S rRNA (uracil1498-N3)-methyltransferase